MLLIEAMVKNNGKVVSLGFNRIVTVWVVLGDMGLSEPLITAESLTPINNVGIKRVSSIIELEYPLYTNL